MNLTIRAYESAFAKEAAEIWNEVVVDGIAFPQTEPLSPSEADEFFLSQSFTALAYDEESCKVLGLYILHPNNIGRCGHIGNASYAVKGSARGQKIGEMLVSHSLKKAKECGFSLMQFNAVVKTIEYARKLYQKLGFVELGIIPGGFHMKDGHFEDIVLNYHTL